MSTKTWSEREAAEAVGVVLATVQNRRKAGLLPKSAKQDAKGRWRYDPDLFALEWAASEPMRAPSPEVEDALQVWREARAKREAAQAALAELELARQRGEVVPAAKVEARLVEVFTACKTKLLGIPTRARQQLPHLTASDVGTLDELVREALEDLANGEVPRG